MVAAIVLAAGASRRLGRPKQTIVLAGETLLHRAVRIAHAAGLAPVILIVAPTGLASTTALPQPCQIVVNAEAGEGMAASIRCGVREAEAAGATGAVLLTCDQVALSAEHLRALYADSATAAGSGYAGKVGIPAFFPARDFAALLQVRGDVGARDLLRSARVVIDEALALDVDTEADLARALQAVSVTAAS